MNGIRNETSTDASPLPDALRWQLRAMRRYEEPANDLWPGIAGALEARPPVAPRPHVPWLAMAASVLLVVGLVGFWQGALGDPVPAGPLALHEANQLARQYESALRELPDASRSTAFAPAFHELDRSAKEIQRALAQDPDSRLLLEQLRRTYSQRLALSQRALHG